MLAARFNKADSVEIGSSQLDGSVSEERLTSGHRAGDVLEGKYVLDHLAGEGSIGEVWLATNATLDMPVAIKLLRARGAIRRAGFPTLSTEFDAGLLREAKAIAKLTHPSIVRVFDFGLTDAGSPFIVMECLSGEDLRDHLGRVTRLSAEDAILRLLPIAHAAHAAHVRGIVHRDLKPENIFLAQDEDGAVVPKILDFGIAQLPWHDEAGRRVAGTLHYMAPEQAAGDPKADHRVDVYALSVVLYELISGRTPMERTSEPHSHSRLTRRAHKDFQVPALTEQDGVDQELWQILLKGLEPKPESRWRSMRELGEALAGWLSRRGVLEDAQGVSLKARWLIDTAPLRMTRGDDLAGLPIPSASSDAPPRFSPSLERRTFTSATSSTAGMLRPRRRGAGVLLAGAAMSLLAMLGGGLYYAGIGSSAMHLSEPQAMAATPLRIEHAATSELPSQGVSDTVVPVSPSGLKPQPKASASEKMSTSRPSERAKRANIVRAQAQPAMTAAPALAPSAEVLEAAASSSAVVPPNPYDDNPGGATSPPLSPNTL